MTDDPLLARPAGTVAVLTPGGRGAVATIRWRGDPAVLDQTPLFRAANGQPMTSQPVNRVLYGRWRSETGEEVVLCRTAGDELEIHCHGGIAACRQIVGDLVAAGGIEQTWSEQCAAGSSLLETELRQCLARATTVRTAEILLEQLSVGLMASVERWEGLPWTEADRQRVLAEIDALLEWSPFGLHLSEPWRIVLTGRPNVGKSSLINALLGYQRAIVFDQPGTTRDVVTGETAFEGWPVQLADTAGLRSTAESLEAAGIARARGAAADADLVLLLLDVSEDETPEEVELRATFPTALVVLHKSDLTARGDRRGDGLAVSSVTGLGLAALQKELLARLIPAVPAPGTPLPVTLRQVECLNALRSPLITGDRSGWQTGLHNLRGS